MHILLLIACASAASGAIGQVQQSNVFESYHDTCPITGYEVKGHQWYRCIKGQTKMPIGCSTDSGVTLKFYEKFEDEKAEWLCDQEDGKAVLRPISCRFRGKLLKPGEIEKSDAFYYQCGHRPTGGIGIDLIGCRGPKDTMVSFGEEYEDKNFIFKCEKEGKKAKSIVIRCVGQDRRFYEVGQSWAYNNYYYTCLKKGNYSARIQIVGCADDDGKKLDLGDTYVKGPIVYQCQETTESFRLHPIGCYAKDHRNEQFETYLFGDVWYESFSDKFGYLMQCTSTEKGVTHTPIECVHHHPELGDIYLKIGCITQVDQRAFLCKALEGRQVMASLKKVPKGVTLEAYVSSLGVKFCQAHDHSAAEQEPSVPADTMTGQKASDDVTSGISPAVHGFPENTELDEPSAPINEETSEPGQTSIHTKPAQETGAPSAPINEETSEPGQTSIDTKPAQETGAPSAPINEETSEPAQTSIDTKPAQETGATFKFKIPTMQVPKFVIN